MLSAMEHILVDHSEISAIAAEHFARGRNFTLRPIGSGNSQAHVYVFEILGADNKDDESAPTKSGRYVLKLTPKCEADTDHNTEFQEAAQRFNEGSDYQVIPDLVGNIHRDINGSEYTFELFEVAGRNLDAISAPVSKMDERVFLVLPKLFSRMFDRWSNKEVEPQKVGPGHLLRTLLGYRSDRQKATELHEFVEGIFGSKPFSRHGEYVLMNPLQIQSVLEKVESPEIAVIFGILHRDLHSQNVLFEYSRRDPKFWVIDFALSRIGPVGFDQAYFQISQLLINLDGLQPSTLLGALEAHYNGVDGPLEMPEFAWLSRFLRLCADIEEAWLDNSFPNWSSDLKKQLDLAKIAAGINWANKSISRDAKLLATLFASYHATRFMRNYHKDAWQELLSANGEEAKESVGDSAVSDSDWAQVWDLAGGFNIRDFRYVLIAEPQRDVGSLEALGRLPWDLVIDLDPDSTEVGLLSKCKPEITVRNSLHTSATGDILGLGMQGVTWFFANGWHSRSIPTKSLRDWTYESVDTLRLVAQKFVAEKSEKPTIAVVLPGYSGDPKRPHFRLEKCIEVIDEALRGTGTFLIAGDFEPAGSVTNENKVRLGIDVASLTNKLSQIISETAVGSPAMIPAEDGSWVSVDNSRLVVLEESLDVLHSQVLARNSRSEEIEFWKGRAPSWHEIALGVDINRNISEKIEDRINGALEDRHSRTILVSAVPGSGATTVLKRVAWGFRERFATVVVTNADAWISAKVATLYNISRAPVLIFAESNLLGENAREDLFKELTQSGVRFVLIYFRRSFRRLSDDAPDGVLAESGLRDIKYERDRAPALSVPDPMPRSEAKEFLARFVDAIEDEERQAELHRITYDENLARYRSPFFYGLVAFQREFLKVDEYVEHHLRRRNLSRKTEKLFEFLALTTLFSSAGLSRKFINGVLGLDLDSRLPLNVPLGEEPVGLIVEQDGYFRLSHQIIAESVFQHLNGTTWRSDLADVASDFVDAMGGIFPSPSNYLLDLLKEIFIDRTGQTGFENEDRKDFSPLIELVSDFDPTLGSEIFKVLTLHFPQEAHFWTHRGRFQLYRRKLDDLASAEEFIEKAVLISPKDSLHHHVLGMVRRQRMRQVLQDARSMSPLELLDAAGRAFEQAADCFTKSRELSPKDSHGYITHAQLILEMAQALKKAGGENSILSLPVGVTSWMQGEMSLLHDLLGEVETLYAELDGPDRYVESCRANLQDLMGDLDEVVRTWELFNAGRQSDPYSRRALAQAYLDRRAGDWKKLSTDELETIIGHTSRNISGKQSVDRDYELWFEAKLRHPEFDPDEVTVFLARWKERSQSWRPHYYLGCIGFVRWFLGMTDSRDFETDLENGDKLYNGRRGVSFLWIGRSSNRFPLVSSHDLGKWDRKQERFWDASAQQRLLRLGGFVSEKPLRPQKGEINISQDIRAFFVPGKEVAAGEQENSPISFFLGISLEGLRAWKTEVGDKNGMKRVRVSEPDHAFELIDTQGAAHLQDLDSSSKKSATIRRAKAFIRGFVTAALERDGELVLSDLERATSASFAQQVGDVEDFGFSFLNYVRSISGVQALSDDSGRVVISKKSEQTVRPKALYGSVQWYKKGVDGGLLDQHGQNRYFRFSAIHRHSRKLIEKGAIVTFVPDQNFDEKRGLERPAAKDLQLWDGPVPGAVDSSQYSSDELRYMVEKEVLDLLKDAESSGHELGLADIEAMVRFRFRFSGEIGDRLDTLSFVEFLRELPSVWVDFQSEQRVVSTKDVEPFGRVLMKQPNETSNATVAAQQKKPAYEEAHSLAFAFIEEQVKNANKKNQKLKLETLASRTSSNFKDLLKPIGAKNVHSPLGFKTFSEMIDASDKFEIELVGSDRFIRFSKETRLSKNQHRAGTQTDEVAKPGLTRAAFESWLVKELTSDRNLTAEGILVSQISQRVAKQYKWEGKLAEFFGAASLSVFLGELDDFDVRGSKPETRRVYYIGASNVY